MFLRNLALWLKPRPDTTPPSAVTDLTAVAEKGSDPLVSGGLTPIAAGVGSSSVRLTWTAPGDDGTTGTAAVYQVKWATGSIVDTADTEPRVNFWAAENVIGEPKPREAGSKETLVIRGLKPGMCYFTIKSRDECNNESPISNVVKVEVR